MIPGSMGTRSYIVVGMAQSVSFNSAPHGAGRRSARTTARSLFSMEDLQGSMAGIEYRHSAGLLDEIWLSLNDCRITALLMIETAPLRR